MSFRAELVPIYHSCNESDIKWIVIVDNSQIHYFSTFETLRLTVRNADIIPLGSSVKIAQYTDIMWYHFPFTTEQ